jgi:hypothetical protein
MAYESFPDGLVFQSVALEPEPGSVVRSVTGAPALLADRLRFAGPQVTPIDARYRADDQDLQAFIANTVDKRFVLAIMALDFPTYDGPELASANVKVALRDSAEPSEAIAWSLLPMAAGSPYELTRGYDVSPSLKIGTVGVAAKGQTATVDHGQRTYLRGSGELTADPSWAFTPTATQKLEGSTRLSMVIQIPRQRTGTISVTLAATTGHGRFRKRRIPLQGDTADAPREVQF